jgi:putative transposase
MNHIDITLNKTATLLRMHRTTYSYLAIKMKPNTYTQLHIHLVFAVKFRKALISPTWNHRLHEYIGGIIKYNKHQPLAINSMPDHIHILAGLNPNQAIADLIRFIKKDSTVFINKEKLATSHFNWQEGYGAFSVSHSRLAIVANYIHQQQEQHKKLSFKKEYTSLLDKHNIQYNTAYLFQDPA